MSSVFNRWPEDSAVLRARSAGVALWTIGILAVFLLGDSAVRGRWDIVGIALPWSLLVLWAIWALAYRPVVVYDGRAVIVRNVFREVSFGWAQVREISDRYQFVFDLRDGSRVKAWGGPVTGPAGGRKIFGRREGLKASALVATPLDHMNDARREGRTEGTAPIDRRWDLLPLILGVVLVVWVFCVMVLK